MKYFSIGLFIALFIISPIFSQNYINDPLEDHYIIRNGGGQELVNSDNYKVSIFKYYKAMEIAPWDTVISVLEYSHATPNGFTDMITSDLDADSLNEIIKVWTEGISVKIAVLKPDPYLLSIDTLADWKKIVLLTKNNPPPYRGNWQLPDVVLVQSGNFDNDLQREFVTAYWSTNGYVNLTVYDVDDSLNITEKGSIMDQQVQMPPLINLCEDYAYLFDIECGDFNGDGIDEILLGGREPANPSGWQFFTNIYAYDEPSGNLIAKVKEAIYIQPDPLYDVVNFNLAAGHFTSSDKDQAVVGFYQCNPTNSYTWDPDTISFTIIPIEINDLLTDIMAGPPLIQKQDTTLSGCYNRISTLEAKDVNYDGQDEIVSAFSHQSTMKTFKIYQMSTNLDLSVWADLDSVTEDYHACVAFGDIVKEAEEDTPYMEFALTLGGWQYSVPIYRLKYNDEGAFNGTDLLNSENTVLYNTGKTESFQIAECDADIRIGTPRRFSATSIIQPLVILNAPPIHFDVFNQQIYDVCQIYNGNVPQFVSTYEKTSSQLAELETEINRDWALSTEVSAGFSLWGFSVGSHFSQTWGDKFSRVDNTTTKVTVGISVNAIEDDRIFAVVMDYDIWEYPIYVNNELKAQALVVEPNATAERRWFPSKSWSGQSYIPEHEVGNIFSYREYPILSNNPNVDEKIKGDYETSFVLDANSSYDWTLQFDDFQSSGSSTTKEYTRDWAASVSGWGAGFSINGSYHSEDINTQRTEVADGLYLSVHLDGIDMGIGEVGYIVTPYAYWAKNGSLILDYAVKPELAPIGGTPTWWQVHYQDLSDPAFVLPWRYDPEKGFTLQDETKRYQTKDLQFYPSNPLEGDTVMIEARINNFSLIPTPGLINVSFYLGNPDSGGVLLENINGETEVYTNQAISARGTEIVHFNWIVNSAEAFPRIFAVIDKDNQLNEIHKNNNKSWTILNKSTSTGVENPKDEMIPSAFNLFHNYPNPFNPSTKIKYSVAQLSKVTLKIFDVLGKEIQTLVNEEKNPGNYELHWNASKLPSGVYFYRLQAGGFVQTRKMILLK